MSSPTVERPEKRQKTCASSEGVISLRYNANDLSGEIRNRIYEYVLTEPEPVCLCVTLDYFKEPICCDDSPVRRVDNPIRRTIVSNVLLVNKKTYAEGMPLLYHNHFSFFDSLNLYCFFMRLNPKTKQLVETISVRPWQQPYEPDDGVFTQRIGANNLKRVTIKETMDYDGTRNTARIFCHESGVRGWIVSLGQNDVERGAALDRLLRFEGEHFPLHLLLSSPRRKKLLGLTESEKKEMEEEIHQGNFRYQVKLQQGLSWT